jgi:hypothetical protein
MPIRSRRLSPFTVPPERALALTDRPDHHAFNRAETAVGDFVSKAVLQRNSFEAAPIHFGLGQ